ncbi:hypothetical protein H4582DRAFT_1162369 [Lactarius indigo]|nr:hypothetical protein H4582DRAFT_1162369 [Lactarius indigo]
MLLSYSKWQWGQLEVSDSSDIEGHPNVDKKSPIRSVPSLVWKSMFPSRRVAGGSSAATIVSNNSGLRSLVTMSSSLVFAPFNLTLFSRCHLQNAAKPVPYDEMILTLLQTVAKEAQENTG